MHSRNVLLVLGLAMSPLSCPSWAAGAAADSTPAKQTAPSESNKKASPGPFKLTAGQRAEVDRVLKRWEQWNAGIKTFDCRFTRWIYDPVFSDADRPLFVESGGIRYAPPGRIAFWIDRCESGGTMKEADDSRAERWVFDGNSVYQYRKSQREIVEHFVPPEIQSPLRRATDGPLAFGFPIVIFRSFIFRFLMTPACTAVDPFPFGANAEDLKRQYYLRTLAPDDPKEKEHVWLEAFPRTKSAAAFIGTLQLVLVEKDSSPFALRVVDPDGGGRTNYQRHTNYQFYDVSVNGASKQAADDWFRPAVPASWRLIRDAQPR
jgi:hypothetical protein